MLQSNSPVSLNFPPFRGATRKIVLAALATFVAMLLLGATPLYAQVFTQLVLVPQLALFHKPWQLLTYAFLPTSLLSSLFALLSVWMFGSQLEDARGSRWLTEYFLTATIGGALLASAIALTGLAGVSPRAATLGLWPAVMALLLAFARFNPELPLRVFGILPVKAKHLVAIYLLVYLVTALLGGDRLGATTALCAALAGFLYLRFVPRQGLTYVTSEQWFGLRNAYYRAKRRRAAKKFTVYMRKQGKDVSLDPSGKYIPVDDERRDPTDKRWMN